MGTYDAPPISIRLVHHECEDNRSNSNFCVLAAIAIEFHEETPIRGHADELGLQRLPCQTQTPHKWNILQVCAPPV